MPPSKELLDKILKMLRRYTLGLSRTDLRRLCGPVSLRRISEAVVVLLSRGDIKVLPMFGGHAQKFALKERNKTDA